VSVHKLWGGEDKMKEEKLINWSVQEIEGFI